MSSQSGFDYDLLISRLHGGVCAFQSLRAHRRQRDQPPAPAPDERPTPPPSRPSQPHPDEPAEARAVSSLEPQAFIAVNGRVVPLFGDLGGGMFAPASPGGPMPPASTDAPPPPRTAPSLAQEEPKPPPAATAPAPAPSPLKLPPPTPPARLGLIYGGHPRPPATDAPPPASAARPPASDDPTTSSTRPDQATPPKVQELPTTAALAALLEARAQEEAQRLEEVHAEHRACITQLLQAHRDELRAQSEADAARTTQLLRDLLAEHRAELAAVARTHADHLAQILSQHHEHVTRHEPAPPSDDVLRSALIEQAKLQSEANEGMAEHIGALTTIVADLGQTVGMLAVAAVQGSCQAVPSPSTQFAAAPARQAPPATNPSLSNTTSPAPVPADSTAPPVTTSPPLGPAAPERTRTPSGTPQPPSAPITTVSPPTPVSDRARVLQCVDDDRDDDDLANVDQHEPPSPRSRLHPITPLSASEDPGDD